ncbi:MAG: isochorismatase family protein [Candidatus Eisenbacteria bacterium]|nr:isochorismatase family protein [Candidatus Latescibacterota bacterium]MBD3303317.1 isochorismatase family protein [Candidatus Eisenbacteria bacterium]
MVVPSVSRPSSSSRFRRHDPSRRRPGAARITGPRPGRQQGRPVRCGGEEVRVLHRERAVLVVIDVQERLLPSIDEAERTVGQIVRLIQGFRIIGAPVLVTEQYRKGLGETAPAIQEALAAPDPNTGEAHRFDPLEKMTFSCMLHDPFLEALEATGRRQVVLCGIEAHVCVHQTALHLLERGFHVEIASDAVSSRSPRNREVALSRLALEGAKPTTVETAVFEMLEACGTDPFKSWVRVIR